MGIRTSDVSQISKEGTNISVIRLTRIEKAICCENARNLFDGTGKNGMFFYVWINNNKSNQKR